MGLLDKVFGGRKRVEPHGLWADDAAQLAAFEARGGSSEAPRESEFFVSFTSSPRASAAADDLRGRGIPHEVVPPSHDIPEWMIFIRAYRTPLLSDFLRETVDMCEELASRHGGEFEGWAGLFTDAEKDA